MLCGHTVAFIEKHWFQKNYLRTSKLLNTAVKIVNYIKSRPKTSLFQKLCKEMVSLHTSLLLHTEVRLRWLSRSKVQTRLVELLNEIAIYLGGGFFIFLTLYIMHARKRYNYDFVIIVVLGDL